ncbi:MAG TPA: hypothetical protein VLB46_04130 [Pyrinomonadaceae bacterium]|nr:hypothetical protein [Pyrinomonadaceae bacterium]
MNADFDARGLNGRVISDLPNVSIDNWKRRRRDHGESPRAEE